MDLTPDLQPMIDDLVRWLPRLVSATAIAVLTLLVARLARRAMASGLARARLAETHQIFFAGIARWAVIAFGVAAALDAVGLGYLATGLMAGGGMTAIVLGFAFREIGENLLAGVFLAFSRPFEVGDYVQSGDVEGTVVGLDLRTVHVRTPDGRDTWVPNSQIVTQPFTNYTLDGLHQPTFRVGIDYADDVAAALPLLREAVAEIADVLQDPAPRVALVGLDGAWVTLEIACWMDSTRTSRLMLEVRSDAMEAVRTTLRAHGYTLSCDTTTGIAMHPSSDVRVRVAS